MANPRLNYTQDEQNYDWANEASKRDANLNEIDLALKGTKDPKARGVIQQEQSRIKSQEFRVNTVDGKTFVIKNAPPGATKEEVLDRVKQRLSPIGQLEQGAQKQGYDLSAARKAGLSDKQISEFLAAHPYLSEEQAGQQAAEGMSEQGKFFTGMGKEVAKAGRGVSQLLGRTSQEEIDRAGARDKPLETGNASAGALAGQVGMMMLPGGLLKGAGVATEAIPPVSRALTTAGKALSGNVPGPAGLIPPALEGAAWGGAQPTETGESRVKNTALGLFGGAGGGLAAKLGGRIVNPKLSKLNPEQEELKSVGQNQYGFPFTPGQATGRRWMQSFESTLATLPGGSGRMQDLKRTWQEITNHEALRSVGEGGNTFSPEMLSSADAIIGSKFDKFKAGNYRIGPDFTTKLQGALAEYQKLKDPAPGAVQVLQGWLDTGSIPGAKSILKSGQVVGQMVPGDVLLSNRSALAKDATDAFRAGEWQKGQAQHAIVEAIDDAIGNSLPANQKTAWQQTRQEYRNLIALNKAYDPAQPGNLNVNKLSEALKSEAKPGSQPRLIAAPTGADPLVDMVRINRGFADKIPNSGTPERAYWMNTLFGGLGAGGGFMAGGAPGAIAGAAAVPAASYSLARAFTSPSFAEYATKGIPMLRDVTETKEGASFAAMLAKAIQGGGMATLPHLQLPQFAQ